MSRFLHLCHMLRPPMVSIGQYVRRGDQLGYVGSTGHSSGAHVHMEGTLGKPESWYQYPNKKSKAELVKIYFDPAPFIKDNLPCPLSYYGYHFLEWAPSEGGFHLGTDINSPNDLGKPVYAPCNGRVQCSEGEHWIKNILGKIIPSVFNHGFGNHVWIEVDEGNPGI